MVTLVVLFVGSAMYATHFLSICQLVHGMVKCNFAGNEIYAFLIHLELHN